MNQPGYIQSDSEEDLFPQENVVRGKRNSVTFKNLNPFINQTPKLFNVNRKKRNSCMIPLPLTTNRN